MKEKQMSNVSTVVEEEEKDGRLLLRVGKQMVFDVKRTILAYEGMSSGLPFASPGILLRLLPESLF